MIYVDGIIGNHGDSIDDVLSKDVRVQHEFNQLSRLLEEIVDIPLNESPVSSDPDWTIPENHVSRWVITLQGEMDPERVSRFRQTLMRCQNVIDAHVHDLLNGYICIRLVTTGGIQMGPVEQAINVLRNPGRVRDRLTLGRMTPVAQV